MQICVHLLQFYFMSNTYVIHGDKIFMCGIYTLLCGGMCTFSKSANKLLLLFMCLITVQYVLST